MNTIHKTVDDIQNDFQWFADDFGITITEFSLDYSSHRPPYVDFTDIHGNEGSVFLGTWLSYHSQYSSDFVFSNAWTDISPEWIDNASTDILQNLETQFIVHYTTQPENDRDIRQAFSTALLNTLEYIHHNIEVVE